MAALRVSLVGIFECLKWLQYISTCWLGSLLTRPQLAVLVTDLLKTIKITPWKVGYKRLQVFCWFYWNFHYVNPANHKSGSSTGQLQHSQTVGRKLNCQICFRWFCGHSQGVSSLLIELCEQKFAGLITNNTPELQLKIRSTEVIFSLNLHVSFVILVC